MRTPLAALGFGLLALVPADGRAGAVQEANATCMSATAILVVSDGAEDTKPWRMIHNVIRTNKKWKIVPAPLTNAWGRVALVRWSIKHPYKGGPTTAYTVQCGDGGTCNAIAKKMAERFPEMVRRRRLLRRVEPGRGIDAGSSDCAAASPERGADRGAETTGTTEQRSGTRAPRRQGGNPAGPAKSTIGVAGRPGPERQP